MNFTSNVLIDRIVVIWSVYAFKINDSSIQYLNIFIYSIFLFFPTGSEFVEMRIVM